MRLYADTPIFSIYCVGMIKTSTNRDVRQCTWTHHIFLTPQFYNPSLPSFHVGSLGHTPLEILVPCVSCLNYYFYSPTWPTMHVEVAYHIGISLEWFGFNKCLW
jgi:hypothetical protein